MHTSIDAAITALVNGNKPPRILRRQPATIRSPMCSTHGSTLCGDGLSWAATPETSLRLHWDFPAAVRAFAQVYYHKTDEKECQLGSAGLRCFHMLSIDIFGWLQRMAWFESKYRVFSTVGTILPAELTERIFIHALEAEDILFDPDVKQREDCSTARNAESLRDDIDLNEHIDGYCTELKEAYRCAYMRVSRVKYWATE